MPNRLASFALALALVPLGQAQAEVPGHLAIPGADPRLGQALILEHGCGTCHFVEGVAGAEGTVGPRLANFAGRSLIAGRFPNVPRFLVPWIMNPPALKAETAMPDLGVSGSEARHIASYLYTLGSAGPPPPSVAVTDRSGMEAEALRAEQLRRLEEGPPGADGQRVMGIERAIEALATGTPP